MFDDIKGRREFFKGSKHYDEDEVKYRQTGRTTALALKYLSEAMQNPNHHISIVDHLGTKMGDHICLMEAQHIVKTMKYKNFVFDIPKCKVIFKLKHLTKLGQLLMK